MLQSQKIQWPKSSKLYPHSRTPSSSPYGNIELKTTEMPPPPSTFRPSPPPHSPRCSRLNATASHHHLFDTVTQRDASARLVGRRPPARAPQRSDPDADLTRAYAAKIGACVRARRWKEVWAAFASMLAAGAAPDRYLLAKVLRACAELRARRLAAAVHALAAKSGPELVDAFVGNALVHMYAEFGDVAAARAVFAGLPERDVVAWTALVGAYADAGQLDEAYELFEAMRASGVHADLISWNALVSGFARNGDVASALHLFDEMQMCGIQPAVSSWNGIISGCVQNAFYSEALELFREMCESKMPNDVTLSSILPACTSLQALGLGKELHCYVLRRAIKINVYIGTALIAMYSGCRAYEYARAVFSAIEEKTPAVWNELIQSYIDEGKMDEASKAFHSMQEDGLEPDVVLYNSFLAAYARMGWEEEAFKLLFDMVRAGVKPNVVSMNALISGFHHCSLHAHALDVFRTMQQWRDGKESSLKILDDNPIRPSGVTIAIVLSLLTDLKLDRIGKEVHCYALRNDFVSDVFVSSKLVELYGKTGNMVSAVNVFWGITNKNSVTWNILLAAYNHNMQPEIALKLFSKMLVHQFIPDLVTVGIALFACGMVMALRFGRELHGYIEKSMPDGCPSTLASALIDMYGKCGSIKDARLVFDSTVRTDISVWNAMMDSYSICGMSRDAISLFKDVDQSVIRPDSITFTLLLSACKQEGLMEEARYYFDNMEDAYGIKPTLEHYTCMIDTMGTAGLLEESLEIIRKMPLEPDACLWSILLKACRLHSNYEIGEEAAKELFELEPDNPSNYMVLSNVYANAGLWDSADSVRVAMTERGLHVARQCSWLYLGTAVHAFEAGDCSHPAMEKILSTWRDLAGRMEQSGHASRDIEPYSKVEADPLSCHHTEKIAVCFGIISAQCRDPIRVLKNFRMCMECHSSMKFISRDSNREILISDGCTHHHFRDGTCSCGDEW